MPDSEDASVPQSAVLRLLIELCAQFVGATEGSLLLLDPDDPEILRFAMTVGSRESERVLLGQPVPLGTGVVGLAAVTHEVQVGAPLYEGVVQAPRGEAAPGEPTAVLAAPVLARDELLGVITAVRFGSGERFTREHAVLYGRAAAVAGLVLDQGRRLRAIAAPAATAVPASLLGPTLAAWAERAGVPRERLAELLEALAGLVRGAPCP